MTPAEAFDATRDTFVQLLYAHARADGLTISTGQIYAMLDTALEQAGIRVLIDVVATADAAAGSYAGTYEETPDTVVDADETWRTNRSRFDDYPNLAGLLIPL
jgi:microcystin degradation protein MlrC